MDPLALVLLAVIFFISSCLQGAVGFGLGMLSAPFVAIFDPGLLPGTVILLALMLSSIILVMDRSGLKFKGAAWALVGRIPGSVAAAGLVAIMSPSAIAWAVAVTVLFGVAVSFRGWRPRVTPINQIIAGALSGIMGTTTSVGGAPMSIIWQGSAGRELRGTMSAFFLVGSTVSLLALIAWGAIPIRVYTFSAWMLIPTIAGLVFSRFINPYLNRNRIRAIALGASAVGAISIIVVQTISLFN